MHLQLSIKVSKKVVVVALALLLIVLGSLFYLKQHGKNPLPAHIQRQLDYKAVYPADTGQIDSGSYSYQPDQKSLTFTVKANGHDVIFTEQPAPSSLGSDTQVYYPALGIHPYAQFKTRLGIVALTRFWQSGSFKPVGQSAIMAAKGTLVIAHSQNNLTNAEWKSLFESLKTVK